MIPLDKRKEMNCSFMDIGEKIKMLREKNNLTLEEVGKAVGVGKSTVRKWETGMIVNMRRDKIAALAMALHTTPAYLMGWEEESTQGQKKEAARKDGPTREEIEKELMSLVSKMKPEQKQRVLLEAYRLLQQQNQEDDEAKNH